MKDPWSSGAGASMGPAEQPSAETKPASASGEERYDRSGLLGVGGMGRVYLAQDRLLGRAVALKEAARAGEISDRLQQEAKVTAGLEHPGIVPVHDAGKMEDGRPFYVMRLIHGRALSEVLAERKKLADRLLLLRHYLDACNAVAYAHSQGVLHRDLKPANIMVGAYGETQVVDWGLATIESENQEKSKENGVSPGGAVIGTPAYMSPEQARGETADSRSDVWGLGAVLYEILSGQPPLGEGTSVEVLQRARAGEVQPLPSETPPELATIVAKTLAPLAADRYPSAEALATDIAAWLDGRPVLAHRYSPRELLGRFLRAYRAPLMVAGAAALLLLASGLVSGWRLAEQRDRAVDAEALARQALRSSDQNLSQALVAQARIAANNGLGPAAEMLAAEALVRGESAEARGVLAGTAVLARPERLESSAIPECGQLRLLGRDDLLCLQDGILSRIQGGKLKWKVPTAASILDWHGTEVLLQHGAEAEFIRLEDGKSIGNDEAYLGLYLGAGFSVPKRLGNPNLVVHRHAPSEDIHLRPCGSENGLWVAAHPSLLQFAILCEDGRLLESDLTGRLIRQWDSPFLRMEGTDKERLVGMVYSPDGQQLVAMGTRGSLTRMALGTGESVTVEPARTDMPQSLIFSTDGQKMVVRGDLGRVEVRDLRTLSPLLQLPAVGVQDLLFLEDGSLLVATHADGKGTQTRWRLPEGRVAGVLHDPVGLTGAVFSPDGTQIATSHGDSRAVVWSLPEGQVSRVLDFEIGTVKQVVYSLDGRELLGAQTGSAILPYAIRRFDIKTGNLLGKPIPLSLRRLLLLADDTVVGVSYIGGLAGGLRTGNEVIPLTHCPAIVLGDVGISPHGTWGVTAGSEGEVVRIRSGPATCMPTMRGWNAGAVDISEDGDTVVLGTDQGVERRKADGTVVWRVSHPKPGPLKVSLSPDEKWVAAAATDHMARIYDAADGRLVAVLAGHQERVVSVDFSPDSKRLVTASWDRSARIWETEVLEQTPQEILEKAEKTWGITMQDALVETGI